MVFHLCLVSCHLIIEHCTLDFVSNEFSEPGKDNLRDFSGPKHVTIIDISFHKISTF